MTVFPFSSGGIVAHIRAVQRLRDGSIRAAVDFLRGDQLFFTHRAFWTDAVERGAVAEKLSRDVGIPADSVAEDLLRMEGVLTSSLEQPSERADDVEDAAAWPERPGDAAFSGLAGRIVSQIEPYTESDPIAVLVNVVVAFGNAVGNGPHFMVGATRHGTNLFAALVGDTSKARKGDSWPPVKWLFRRADLDWAAERVKSGASSGEGLIWHVRDPIEKMEAIKEKGRTVGHEPVVVDQGVADKRLLDFEPELARVLQTMSRAGNILSPVFRDAWDRGTLDSLTKNSPAKATDAHISLLGHITQDELRRCLTDVQVANGFANRLIWVLVRRSRLLPEPPLFGAPEHEALALELREVLAHAKRFALVRRDPEARELWSEVYADLSNARPGLAGTIVARAEAQVTRLATVYALLDGSGVISVRHLTAALELWGYAERSAMYVWGDRLGDPVADTIATALRASGALNRTQISALFGRHASAARIDAALQALREAGRVRTYSDPTDGRSVEYWEWTA
jgi:hypothetical protein